jgi:hypothetical protein
MRKRKRCFLVVRRDHGGIADHRQAYASQRTTHPADGWPAFLYARRHFAQRTQRKLEVGFRIEIVVAGFVHYADVSFPCGSLVGEDPVDLEDFQILASAVSDANDVV